MKPGDEIRLVKENLAFAVALHNGARAGRVPPGALVSEGVGVSQSTEWTGANRPTRQELAAELTRGAANQMRAAFALSALQAQKSLEDAFPGEPIREEWPELRAARSAMFLIGLAVNRSILQPVWECPPPYRRIFHIRRLAFTLNATALEGRVLSWDDFGGLERYLQLLDYCASSANAAVEAGGARRLPRYLGPGRTGFGGVLGAPDGLAAKVDSPSAAVPPRGYPGDTPDRRLAPDAAPFVAPRVSPGVSMEGDREDSWDAALAEKAGQWHTWPAGDEPAALQDRLGGHSREGEPSSEMIPGSNIVGQFVAERCDTGEELRMLAGELYAGFLGWCQASGRQPVSQRAFGMRLTGLGLKRKRRGHGKHWWEGIRLAGY